MTAEPTLDPRKFRDTIGRFATGVTVVTWGSAKLARGMTANAVSSLSLDPMLLLVCVDRKTTAHVQLEHTTAFALNVLADDQIDVANTFARHGVEDMAGVPWQSRITGAPVIDDVLAWIDCEVSDRLEGGDHTIYVGRVVGLEIARPDAQPLLFFGGRYRALGPEL